jgi:MSHA biogenesis protein MshO
MTTWSQRGFTLVEMIMVIVITGIVGGIVAVFLRWPVQQYIDVGRRAEITDTADTAFRRIGRDLRLALPNSVRVNAGCVANNCFMEFLPAPAGGRYCAAAPCNALDFSSTTDNSFAVIGPGVDVAAGDSIVVYNLGIAGADAYEGTSRRAAITTGNNLPAITYALNGAQFPFESPNRRFHIINTPVTYACVGGDLWRYWGYPIQAVQPVALATLNALANVQSALLASNVTNCLFNYTPLALQRSGLVTMRLGITIQGETATLYDAVHVSNQP